MEKIRDHKEYEGNPVGLSEETCAEMREHLDRHLAALWVQYFQYHKHHWLVEGPQFRDLHLFLEENYTEIHEQADAVAERITLLGYDPTTRMENYVKLSYIKQEPEGVFRIRDGVEADMNNERKMAEEFRKSIHRAFELGDYGTKSMLEEFLFKIEDRAHHCEHFLGEDSLAVGYLHTEKEVDNKKKKK
ncbi:Dps family protein [Neolewinella litorea]|uniref:DNA starvation/stationary phase protection protein n=1 Tax=Neolewinella litorea TaxID=2562452 RepID=A0A4S4NMC2_9BACT|nr:DNA starvation/stationary phase protection protein [Neolewinella litorea]THH41069.1 DNA starvation/stationary phase protection protein [Neolewinella litorea]